MDASCDQWAVFRIFYLLLFPGYMNNPMMAPGGPMGGGGNRAMPQQGTAGFPSSSGMPPSIAAQPTYPLPIPQWVLGGRKGVGRRDGGRRRGGREERKGVGREEGRQDSG